MAYTYAPDNVMLIDVCNLWGSLIVIIECMYVHDVLMDYSGNACANRVQDNEFAVRTLVSVSHQ